jgi:hypothetical protein
MYVFQLIVTVVRMKVLTQYGREYLLALSHPGYTHHCTIHLDFSMGGDRRNSTDAPSENWGTAGDRFTLKHILLPALCSR